MSNIFHLAILAGNLDEAVDFYTKVLLCKTDNSEEGKWIDIDFWGNELTLHNSIPRENPDTERHAVMMGEVAVPHFGVHLEREVYELIKQNVLKHIQFLNEPYVRFPGTEYEQETFFIQDNNFNVLEIKSLVHKE